MVWKDVKKTIEKSEDISGDLKRDLNVYVANNICMYVWLL